MSATNDGFMKIHPGYVYVLECIPPVFVILKGLCYMYTLSRLPLVKPPASRIYGLKVALSVCLVVVYLVSIVLEEVYSQLLGERSSVPQATLLVCSFAAWLLCSLILIFEHHTAQGLSWTLRFWWIWQFLLACSHSYVMLNYGFHQWLNQGKVGPLKGHHNILPVWDFIKTWTEACVCLVLVLLVIVAPRDVPEYVSLDLTRPADSFYDDDALYSPTNTRARIGSGPVEDRWLLTPATPSSSFRGGPAAAAVAAAAAAKKRRQEEQPQQAQQQLQQQSSSGKYGSLAGLYGEDEEVGRVEGKVGSN